MAVQCVMSFTKSYSYLHSQKRFITAILLMRTILLYSGKSDHGSCEDSQLTTGLHAYPDLLRILQQGAMYLDTSQHGRRIDAGVLQQMASRPLVMADTNRREALRPVEQQEGREAE